jgi:prepilin-type N-terminal cleavage/methylation domain-containing protein
MIRQRRETDRSSPSKPRAGHVGSAFTLIELLVVVAIIALLTAVLLPTLRSGRLRARIVIAHSDLRQVCIALDAYAMDNHDQLPPTRRACGTEVNYQLPVELSNQFYLPRAESRIPQAEFLDIFDPRDPADANDPQRTYKYRCPGALWQNGQFFDFPDPADEWRPRAEIWVPDDFPSCQSPEGRFFYNRADEPPCPVLYAVWSVGPDLTSAKFPRFEGTDTIDTAKFPLPRGFWLQGSGDTGLITHFKDRDGHTHTSP